MERGDTTAFLVVRMLEHQVSVVVAKSEMLMVMDCEEEEDEKDNVLSQSLSSWRNKTIMNAILYKALANDVALCMLMNKFFGKKKFSTLKTIIIGYGLLSYSYRICLTYLFK